MEKEPKKHSGWGWTLTDYIEHLLRMGKRRESEEFKMLILLFGEQKVVSKVREIKESWKKKDA